MARRSRVLICLLITLIIGGCLTWYACMAMVTVAKPQVRFVGFTPDHNAEFEMINPTGVAYQYSGYGASMPLYGFKTFKGGAWTNESPGWCGTGVTVCILPPHAIRRFSTWTGPEKFRAGVALVPPSAVRPYPPPATHHNRYLEWLSSGWEDVRAMLFGSPYERYMVWSEPVAPHPAVVGAHP